MENVWFSPPCGNKELAVKRVIEVLPASDWLLQGEIQGWLEKHLDVALPSLNEEIERREAVTRFDSG